MKTLLTIILSAYSLNIFAQWESYITTDPITDEAINILAFSPSNNQASGLEVSHMLNDKTLNSIITISRQDQRFIENQTLYVKIKIDGNKMIERIGVVTKADGDNFQINIDQVYSDSNISLFNELINEMKIGSRMTINIGDEVYRFSLKGSSKALGNVMATI